MAHLSKKFTVQGMENESYDETYGISKRALYGWYASGNEYLPLAVDNDGHVIANLSETIAHDDLTDMPDAAGTNTDHDARYVRKVGDTMTGDLTTTDLIKTRTATFTYNVDGTVATIAKTGGRTLTFAYNVDGTVDTISDGTYTKTFAYNVDGTVASITVT